VYSFYLFSAVYVSLAMIVIFMLYRQIKMVDKLYDIPAGEPVKN
jgi:cytochrome d ubiquinol oxidase subunit I